MNTINIKLSNKMNPLELNTKVINLFKNNKRMGYWGRKTLKINNIISIFLYINMIIFTLY